MEKARRRVKLRCVVCKQKFDSKFDGFSTDGIFSVNEVIQNFIMCPRCHRRVDAVVIEIKEK